MPRRRSQTNQGDKRIPVNRERVFREALALTDAGGAEALTIRAVAEHLGVTPMALYHHVRNKDEIVNGMLDLVMGEIELPQLGGNWRVEMARRATSARQVLRKHPWAIHLLQAGTAPGPATLRHHNAVIGVLRDADFSVKDTAHAFALLDSYIYGFALSEATLPIKGPETVAEVAETMMAESTRQGHPLDDYPHLLEFSTEHILQPDYDFGEEFDFGLDLILNGLQRPRSGHAPHKLSPLPLNQP